MNNNLIFSIQTLETDVGGSLKGLKPNKDGVYCGVPVAVIGLESRNKSMYDPASFVNAMTSTQGRFYKALREGHLEGEWGHPLQQSNKNEFINRVMQIDRKNVSHHFTHVWTQDSRDGSHIVVYADIKPSGPMGQYLTESFQDPTRNTAFSLRSLTADGSRLPNGATSKRVISLVTFDAVDCPGYEQASKRFMVSNENFGFQLVEKEEASFSIEEIIQFPDFVKVVGMESIECQELLDIFERDTIQVKRSITLNGIYDASTNAIVTKQGPKSVFHNLF